MLRVSFADTDSLSAADRGLAYGDGLFETIRMVGQQAVLRTHHLNRLAADAQRLGIPVDWPELNQALSRGAQHFSPAIRADRQSESGSWVLKMILTRGSGGRGYRLPDTVEPQIILSAAPMPTLPDQQGVVVRLASFPLVVNPHLAGVKTLNRIEQVMASREFTGDEWELVMADLDGNLVEGTRSNLLARVDDGWVTPPSESLAVAGVMRQYAIERLSAQGERVTEQRFCPQLITARSLRGFYLLNSVVGLVPVKSLDGVNLPVDGSIATICNPLDTLE